MAEATTTTPAAKPASTRKKQRRSVPAGQMHIQASFNNTIITFTDKKGAVLCASSAGACGFRGSKKGTAYAAQVAAEKAAEMVKSLHGTKSVDVFVKGVGLGRDSAVRALTNYDIQVDSIKDVTGVPHGGTRARKARRV
ncbi:MAG TPA: 30S ribosomal protein S11 [Candidatus Saccharibacteria bacterium]|nr:30S ribosomal protein S11 [Candidatus Saccharibacteria bacterium]